MTLTDEQILDIRTVCRLCTTAKRWRYLGSHVAGKHNMTAREYKKEIGVYFKIPLTAPDLEALQRLRRLQRPEEETKTLMEQSVKTRFELGKQHPHYVSEQFRSALRERNVVVRAKICRHCGGQFRGIAARVICADCRFKPPYLNSTVSFLRRTLIDWWLWFPMQRKLKRYSNLQSANRSQPLSVTSPEESADKKN